MVAIVYEEARASGWLRNKQFDLAFIGGITGLALASGAAVLLDHRLLVPILLADLWFLGYHHVVSTFTRLCCDAQSRRQYSFLLFGVPVLIAAACLAAVSITSGLWIIVSVYFYWQWFHYARQSWGVAQSYRRKAGNSLPAPDVFDKVAFYALPTAGMLWRSAQQPDSFLTLPIRMVPMPETMAIAAIAVAVVVTAAWTLRLAAQYGQGRAPLAYVLYLISHQVVFAVAYVAIRDITIGWLVVNIWHNAQYVLFVWMFNNRRFAAGLSPKARLLSWLSQDGRILWYLGGCVAVSTAVYVTLASVIPLVFALPVFLVYQMINFHHYVVDAVIWRREHVRAALEHV